MKKILFIGDSLTWCQNPDTGTRYEISKRWTTMLEKHFGDYDFTFIGIPGVAVGVKPWFNSDLFTLTNLPQQIVYSQLPLDKIFLFFGTNDYLATFERHENSESIIKSLSDLVKKINSTITEIEKKYLKFNEHFVRPEIILITPPLIKASNGRFEINEVIEGIKNYFTTVKVIDISSIETNSSDGVHFTEKNNVELFEILKKYLA